MTITFILVDPSLPENIGATARALNTMGFNSLRLVNPANFPQDKAFHVAHGSQEILMRAGIFPDIASALEDIDFSIANSMKKRSVRHDYHHIARLPEILYAKKQSVKRIAIVFGGEESGLSNDQVARCDMISFIPMKQKYPSLNLSHAVMLYAYMLSPFSIPRSRQKKEPPTGKYTKMVGLTESILEEFSFRKDSNIYSRIFERLALLADDDVNLVLSFLDKLQNKLEH